MAGLRNRHPLCARCQGGALTCLDCSGRKALVASAKAGLPGAGMMHQRFLGCSGCCTCWEEDVGRGGGGGGGTCQDDDASVRCGTQDEISGGCPWLYPVAGCMLC